MRRHAEVIADRILLMEGLPNFQRLFPLRIGQTVREQFEGDLAVEVEVVERLRPGIAMCRQKGDATSANLLEVILADEEQHIDYLRTQMELMDRLGEQLYLAQCVARPPADRMAYTCARWCPLVPPTAPPRRVPPDLEQSLRVVAWLEHG